MGAELASFEETDRANRDPARAGREPKRRARGGARAAARLPRAAPGAARRARIGAGADPLAPRLPPDLTMTRVAAVDLGTNSTRLLVADVDGDRLEEVVHLLTITRLGEGVDERRRLLPVPIARVRNCSPTTAASSRSTARAHARDRDERGARCGERRGVPRRDRVELRLHDALLDGTEEAAMMLRGVAAGRARRSTTSSSWTSAAARPSSSSQTTAVAVGGEPRRRLRALDRALSRLGSAVAARARSCGAYVRALLPPLGPGARSASPAR